MHLFIDTETTGKFFFNAPLSHPDQPRIVQLAAIVADDAGVELAKLCLLISPDCWTIPAEAQAIHGIDTERCQSAGMALQAVLAVLECLARQCRQVVAHNLDFDFAMIASECERLSVENPLRGLNRYCTMRSATDVCKLPGRYGYKWPTLAEAHHHFYQCGLDNAHDALADVIACKKIWQAMNQPT